MNYGSHHKRYTTKSTQNVTDNPSVTQVLPKESEIDLSDTKLMEDSAALRIQLNVTLDSII